jgi:hypothetical protein
MPTDMNESSIASTSMTTATTTTINDTNNDRSSSTNHIRSPPSSLQTSTTTRPNSPSPKQLDKLRRFLSTLYHFGSDISSEIGERVRTLILALVVSFEKKLRLRSNGFFFVRLDKNE